MVLAVEGAGEPVCSVARHAADFDACPKIDGLAAEGLAAFEHVAELLPACGGSDGVLCVLVVDGKVGHLGLRRSGQECEEQRSR